MNKKKENNIIIIMISIIIISIIFISLVFTGIIDFTKNSSSENNINSENSTQHDLNTFLNDVTGPLGWLVVLHNFSQNANRTGINYLSSYEDKEVLVMEYIVGNKDNYNNFIVLNAVNGEKVEDDPTADMTLAYYPYDLFNNEYRKIFNEDFDVTRRIMATGSDNEYDKSTDYIYYPNRHMGANGLYVESIELIDVIYDKDTGKYTANVNMTYSERFASNIGMKDEKAEIIYSVKDGNIIMESFIVGTDL